MANDDKALLEAIAAKEVGDVVALLQLGVSPDGVKTQLGGIPVDFRDSPLVVAMTGGNVAIVAALLHHQAAIYDVSDSGSGMPNAGLLDSALHYLIEKWDDASSKSMRQIGESLLDMGIDVNARDSSGITALHRSVARNQMDAFKFLLDHSADPTVVADDLEQTTPIEDALQMGRMDMLKEMQKTCATSQISMARLFTPLHRMAASGQWGPAFLLLLKMDVDINGLDVRGKRPIDYLPTFSKGCLTAFYAFIAAGAKPSQQMLDTYGEDSLIGEAIRVDRVVAAAICGCTVLAIKALGELPKPAGSDDIEMVKSALLRAEGDCADTLRVWIAKQHADAAMAEIEVAVDVT